MAQECATPAKSLNQNGGNWGNVANPPPAAANNRPPAFPVWPWTKTNPTEGSLEERMTTGHPSSFHNPDPIAHLVECSNEAPIIIDGQGDHGTNWLQCTSLQCEFPVLWIAGTWDPTPGSVIGIRGDGVQPSLTFGSWRSTSRSQGSNVIMSMCCWWLYQPWPILKWSQSWLAPKS